MMIVTYEDSIVKLSELVQELGLRLVDRKILSLDFYGSGSISLSGQQHSRLVLIETEKTSRPRLEPFSRRRIGVVGHGLEKNTRIDETTSLLLEIYQL